MVTLSSRPLEQRPDANKKTARDKRPRDNGRSRNASRSSLLRLLKRIVNAGNASANKGSKKKKKKKGVSEGKRKRRSEDALLIRGMHHD